ncbi:hypothetical protein [Streptomyces wuyuanensis]|uniref:hypothetical protein n=1 Tax=Streptomyces wuyuanensis TaxID=1196353 RepID=UPI003D75ED7E
MTTPLNGEADRPGIAAPPAVVGDPRDPSTWKLPVEAYAPTASETRVISVARDKLIDECMAKAGFEQWVPAPDLPELGGDTPTDWRYGVHDAAQAAKHGYHPDPARQRAYDEALAVGAVDRSGADEGALKGCATTADAQVPPAQEAGIVQEINAQSFKAAEDSPSVEEAFRQWSACMKSKGYVYARPMDANDDPRFAARDEVTDLEIATAKADVECRDRHQVEKTWFDAEVRLQQSAIKKHHAALVAARAQSKATVAKATALAK